MWMPAGSETGSNSRSGGTDSLRSTTLGRMWTILTLATDHRHWRRETRIWTSRRISTNGILMHPAALRHPINTTDQPGARGCADSLRGPWTLGGGTVMIIALFLYFPLHS